MDTFLGMLKGIFSVILTIVISVSLTIWFFASIDTYTTTKENNILLKELCIEKGINVDSVLNAHTNDTLNINVKIGE